jgi:hypothetical protein
MLGHQVSNMYEEIVYRGHIFCACYGVVAAASFPLAGKPSLAGVAKRGVRWHAAGRSTARARGLIES